MSEKTLQQDKVIVMNDEMLISSLDFDEKSQTAETTTATTSTGKKNDLLAINNEQITLNIGGKIFMTTYQTLTKYKESLFYKMFDEKYNTQPNSKNNSYFIDRDGTHFRYILNYLRNGKLILPSNKEERIDLINELIDEAGYYNIESLINVLKIAEHEIIEQDSVMNEEKENKRNFVNLTLNDSAAFYNFLKKRDFAMINSLIIGEMKCFRNEKNSRSNSLSIGSGSTNMNINNVISNSHVQRSPRVGNVLNSMKGLEWQLLYYFSGSSNNNNSWNSFIANVQRIPNIVCIMADSTDIYGMYFDSGLAHHSNQETSDWQKQGIFFTFYLRSILTSQIKKTQYSDKNKEKMNQNQNQNQNKDKENEKSKNEKKQEEEKDRDKEKEKEKEKRRENDKQNNKNKNNIVYASTANVEHRFFNEEVCSTRRVHGNGSDRLSVTTNNVRNRLLHILESIDNQLYYRNITYRYRSHCNVNCLAITKFFVFRLRFIN